MYWSPPATGPPTPSLNGSSIFASAPPSESSTTPVRTRTTRRPSRCGLLRLALPGDADLGQEVVAGRGVLVEALVAVRAVVADGAGADQRLRRGSAASMRLDEVARARARATPRIALARVVGPALGDVLAGEVDDGVAAVELRRGDGPCRGAATAA